MGDRSSSELVNAAEIARRLDLSQERIRQLVKASTMPPASGIVGRNSVWRWDVVEAWAVATGRINDPGDRLLRRPPSIWLDGKRGPMARTVDAVVEVRRAGPVHVRIWQTVDGSGRPAVVLGEVGRRGMLTHAIEEAAEAVVERWLGAGGVDADWFEYLPPHDNDDGQFDVVTFEVEVPKRLRRGQRPSLVQPTWYGVTHAQLEAFLGAPVEVYERGTYTQANVEALAAGAWPTRVDMAWDPAGLVDDVATIVEFDRLALSDRTAVGPGAGGWAAAAVSLAGPAVAKLEAIRADVGAQDGSAPVRKVVPVFDESEWALVEQLAATSVDAGDHEDRYGVVVELRRWLLANDRESAGRLRRTGTGTLAWRLRHETAVSTDDDAPPPVTSTIEAVRHAEHRLMTGLRSDCPRILEDDAPASIPSDPVSTKDALVKRYLDAVTWTEPEPDDVPFAEQLSASLGAPGQFGYDPWSRLVLKGKSAFVVEWPTSATLDVRLAIGAASAAMRVVASPGVGGRPVFVELSDGSLDLLPAGPGAGFAPEFTWGYSGEGPKNLARGLLELGVATSGWMPEDRRELVETQMRLHELVTNLHGPLAIPVEAVLSRIGRHEDQAPASSPAKRTGGRRG